MAAPTCLVRFPVCCVFQLRRRFYHPYVKRAMTRYRLFVLLSCLCFLTVYVSTFPSSTEFECPTVFGIYSDPQDCRRFYQCVWLVAFHHVCGPGTVWNDDMKICDWPSASSCRSWPRPITAFLTKSDTSPRSITAFMTEPDTRPRPIAAFLTEPDTWSWPITAFLTKPDTWTRPSTDYVTAEYDMWPCSATAFWKNETTVPQLITSPECKQLSDCCMLKSRSTKTVWVVLWLLHA